MHLRYELILWVHLLHASLVWSLRNTLVLIPEVVDESDSYCVQCMKFRYGLCISASMLHL